jgi:hypothetical protein
MRPASFCLVGKQAKETASDSRIYMFVDVKADPPEFPVVPSRTVAEKTRQQGEKFWVFDRFEAFEYQGEKGWKDSFGDPYALPTVPACDDP